MAKLLEDVVEDVRELPEDEQIRAAEVLLAFLQGMADDGPLMA
jgi:hypothetical protein